jgi:UDP-N-acetylmuramate dehydrogenase
MIKENISLKPYNSFGIEATAKSFVAFKSLDELNDLLHDPVIQQHKHQLILGGGSNLLFTKNFDGLVLKNEIMGIEKVKEDAHHIWVRTGAGENWHRFVLYCIDNNLAGVENLSLIPGCTGASPMQNIGAYGVEIKDAFHSLEAYHLKDKHAITFSNNDCEFGYRESVFKNVYKNQFIITHVTYRLNKEPIYNTSYGAVEQELEAMGIKQLSIKAISDAVISIRQSKLPDPAVAGNAGSFFKNPVIGIAQYTSLKKKHATMPGYEQPPTDIKVPAGWLIEQCGWKGYRKGDAGVHPKQALVLVNYGNASGAEIYNLSTQVKKSVMEKFGIDLEREVNII